MLQNSGFPIASTLLEGGAIAFAVWQLWSIRPDKKAKAEKPAAAEQPSPEDPGHPEG